MRNMERYHSFYEMISSGETYHMAFVYEEDGQRKSMTYCELVHQIDVFPVDPFDHVGIFMDGSISSVLTLFADIKAGKRIILLNPMDSEKVLRSQIKATHVSCLVGPKELVSLFQKDLSKDGKERERIYGHEDGLLLFFTSGTTSASKAVVLTEEALCQSAYNGSYCLPLKEEDTLLSLLPLSHVFGFVCSLLWPLYCHATVALGRGMRHLADDFRYFHPTAVSLVPQMAGFFALHKLFNPELKLCLVGAGGCPDMILHAIHAMGIRVSYGYGLTETSSGICLSIGDDPKKMTICPDDRIRIAEDGEIEVLCPTTIMLGYYQDEEKTNASFTQDHYLKTGDLGKLDEDNHLILLGRKKEILVLNDGTKVFLPDYEGKLRGLLGMGEDFAVTLNRQNQIVLDIHTEKTKEEMKKLVDRFNTQLTRGQQIVKIKFENSALPKTNTGKVRRYELHVDQEGNTK